MTPMHYEIIHFSGRVQGVGFRYNVSQVAKEFEVCGFVQNLTDGRVRLEVEGKPGEIDGFVEAVHERMDGFIRNIERERGSGRPGFVGFQIR